MTAPAKLIELNFAEDPARWLRPVEGASNLKVYDTGSTACMPRSGPTRTRPRP